MKPKAVVAMSGGVDSSVAAALMKEDGFDVVGIMMKLWEGEAANNESGCCSLDAAEDARRVAQMLDIPFYVFNFASHFNETVVANFVSEYARGRTPNPCITCNRAVKFSALSHRARKVGATALATGHYARVETRGSRRALLRGRDPSKDQSYVLYMLDQMELEMARFPVGEYSKPEIREIAATLGFRTAHKPESQEICFVPNGDSHRFLESRIPEGSVAGAVVTTGGDVVGSHRGFAHYTIGQRKGLGVARGLPLYVSHISAERNEVVIGTKEDLRASALEVEDVTLIDPSSPKEFACSVMTRYRGPEARAFVSVSGRSAHVAFDDPVDAPAPGQAAVFYSGEEVLGGGTIGRAA